MVGGGDVPVALPGREPDEIADMKFNDLAALASGPAIHLRKRAVYE